MDPDLLMRRAEAATNAVMGEAAAEGIDLERAGAYRLAYAALRADARGQDLHEAVAEHRRGRYGDQAGAGGMFTIDARLYKAAGLMS